MPYLPQRKAKRKKKEKSSAERVDEALPSALEEKAPQLYAELDSKEVSMRKKLSLSEKVFAITNACATIHRNGVGQSNDVDKPLYSYVKIEDVLAVVNPLLKRYKLILTGNVAKEPITHVGKAWATTEALVDWTLEDTEESSEEVLKPGAFIHGDKLTIGGATAITRCKESRTWRVPGCGSDDQGKGIYKALTGSRKYALVLIFNLKFGDEPEGAVKYEKANGSTSAGGDPGSVRPELQ